MRSYLVGVTLILVATFPPSTPAYCQTPASEKEVDLAQEVRELKEENATLRGLLPTAASLSKLTIADLLRETVALREGREALIQEADRLRLDSDRARSERDRLQAANIELYSKYIAVRDRLLSVRSILTVLPVEVDATPLRAELSAALDAIALKAHLTLDGKQSLSIDPWTVRLEEIREELEKGSVEAEKTGLKVYAYRWVDSGKKGAAELYSTKKITLEIVEGPRAKGWQNIQIKGPFTPTLSPVDGLVNEQEWDSNRNRLDCRILPKKTGSYVLSFEMAGSASKALTQPLEVTSGSWRLPFRFLGWLCTNYLFWLGGILMALIGHADKILSFLKNWRETRRARAASAVTGSEQAP